MIWLKKNLLFTIVIVLLAGALAAEIFYVLGRRAKATEAEQQFMAKVEEYQRLTGKNILPYDRNVALTQAEIDLQIERATEYRNSLLGREEMRARFESPPPNRADAFFDIASFVEDYRVKADQAGVELGANEFFGFGAFSTSGPDEARIPEVYRQRLIVAYILDRLFQSRPVSLGAIVREGEARAAAQPGRGALEPTTTGGFRLGSGQSLATPGLAETTAFQVTFTGRTGTLRSFLNSLAEFDLPVVVRHIDVTTTGVQATDQQPTGAEPRRGRGRAVDTGPARETGEAEEAPPREENILIIPETLATFTVSLEYLDVLPLQAAAGR